MKVSRSFLVQAQKSLAESIDFRSMIHLAREILPNYDIYKRKNVTESIAITRMEASEQIITDMYEQNLLMQFLSILLSIQTKGLMGRKYKISGINILMKNIHDLGFIYDSETYMLLEHPKYRISRNWGVLQEGSEYVISLVWIDIVDYSKIIKKYGSENFQQTYDNFLQIVRNAVERRNGRIWSIEGDGILCAFHFYNKGKLAVLCALDILHSLIDYNLFTNKLDSSLYVRLSIHGGTCIYHDSREEMTKSDTIKECISYQNIAKKSEITASKNFVSMLDSNLAQLFKPVSDRPAPDNYIYSIGWE